MKKIDLNNCFSWVCQLVILMGVLASCEKKEAITGSREGSTPPEKALSTFELEKGFKIELLAIPARE